MGGKRTIFGHVNIFLTSLWNIKVEPFKSSFIFLALTHPALAGFQRSYGSIPFSDKHTVPPKNSKSCKVEIQSLHIVHNSDVTEHLFNNLNC
jgi:hypothetical protein